MSQVEKCEECGIDEYEEIIEKWGNQWLCSDCKKEIERYFESCTRGL